MSRSTFYRAFLIRPKICCLHPKFGSKQQILGLIRKALYTVDFDCNGNMATEWLGESTKLFYWKRICLSLDRLDFQWGFIRWSLRSQCTQCIECTLCDQLAAPLRKRFCCFFLACGPASRFSYGTSQYWGMMDILVSWFCSDFLGPLDKTQII